MKPKYLHFTFILFSFFQISSLHSQIYVNANVIGGNNDGTAWQHAFLELSDALNSASSGDQIWVAAGTYTPTNSTTRNISFDLPQGVFIYGGFQGIDSETNLNQRDWTNNPTILSGNIGDLNDDSDNSFIVVYVRNNVTAVTLDGFTIERGYANDNINNQKNGSGLFINSYNVSLGSAPIINNCTFKNNYSQLSGGAVYIEGGKGITAPIFYECIFENNKSGSSGGAIYINGSDNGNVASTITNCMFSNNQAGDSGGAIFNHGGFGGSASPILKQCNFESNISITDHGGAMYNQGSQSGGNASPTIINCRFFDNSGYAAGAIYNNGSNTGNSSPIITSCTFAGNYTTGNGGTGGAIYCNGTSGTSAAEITNCIIWGNNAPYGSQVLRSVQGSPTISYSIVDAGSCALLQSGDNPNVTCGDGMKFNEDPLFTYEAGGDLTLQTGSPAINSGNNNMNTESIDLAKEVRIMASTIDLGAYEKASALPIELISFNADLRGDQVNLNWVTANEWNNDFFTIEHSTDGVDFKALEKIQGAGNSSTIQSYQTAHQNPSQGFNYYRLLQTDFDGTSSYSSIKSVEVFDGKIGAYPNPVRDHLNISFSDFKQGKIEFGIYNIYGKEVHRAEVEIQDGLHVIELNKVDSFLPGNYFIKIFNSHNGSYVYKFQKIRD